MQKKQLPSICDALMQQLSMIRHPKLFFEIKLKMVTVAQLKLRWEQIFIHSVFLWVIVPVPTPYEVWRVARWRSG